MYPANWWLASVLVKDTGWRNGQFKVFTHKRLTRSLISIRHLVVPCFATLRLVSVKDESQGCQLLQSVVTF